MNRRDRTAEEMAHRVVADALADAGSIPPTSTSWSSATPRPAGSSTRGASGASPSSGGPDCATPASSTSTTRVPAAHRPSTWPPWPPWAGTATVLAVGVEKMWTGDRASTLAGIEDGVPRRGPASTCTRRSRTRRGRCSWPSTPHGRSILMEERGATVEQFAAVGGEVPAARVAQPARPVPSRRSRSTRCSASPTIVAPLTRADVLVVHRRRRRRGPRPGPSPVHRGSAPRRSARATATSTTTSAWPRPARPPGTTPASIRPTSTCVELHDATSPEELYRPRVARVLQARRRRTGHPGRRHHHRRARARRSTRAEAWSAGAIRWAPPASPRWSSWSPSCGAEPADGRSRGPDWRWRPIPVA